MSFLACFVCVSAFVTTHRYPDDLNEGVVLRVLARLKLQFGVHGDQVVLLCLQANQLGTQGVQLCTLIG